ncbi:hypothetical protein [Reyranella massiliensis]|uniref:hypothetical protein n=1 Tax=Reyranella massiliensis TaxID=445220 RepID=UPI0011D1DAE9|nr:hypothetical protein [Reyranella massiliensis]
MKIFLLGSGPAGTWARAFLGKVSDVSAAKPEIVIVDGLVPHDVLAALDVAPTDILILAQQAPFSNGDAPADVSTDTVRHEAQKAILAIELARRILQTLPLRPTEEAEWPRLIAELVGVNPSDVLPLAEPLPILAVAGDRSAAASASPAPSPSLLRTYLAPLLAAAEHPASIVVAWPRDCFLYGDAPGEGLPATVELAGRGRILAYGPYMPLPSGRWRATAYLGFSADIGSMPFILEADTDAGITRGFFEVKQGGIFTLELAFEVTNPFHPVEFRLVSQDSALEGLASLIEIRLEQPLPITA